MDLLDKETSTAADAEWISETPSGGKVCSLQLFKLFHLSRPPGRLPARIVSTGWVAAWPRSDPWTSRPASSMPSTDFRGTSGWGWTTWQWSVRHLPCVSLLPNLKSLLFFFTKLEQFNWQLDPSDVVGFTAWQNGEPNSSGDCAYLWRGVGFKWGSLN